LRQEQILELYFESANVIPPLQERAPSGQMDRCFLFLILYHFAFNAE